MLRRLTAIALFVGFIVVSPRSSEAAMLDFIWGLSGPQLVGVGVGWRWDFTVSRDVCEVGSALALSIKAEGREDWRKRVYFSVGATFFTSTGTDSATKTYRFDDVNMLAFEPSVSVRTFSPGDGSRLRVYHGVGPTFDRVFGRSITTFDNVGIKVTLVEFVLPKYHVSFGSAVRLYPNGFTDDEFGSGPHLDFDRRHEYVWGGTFGVLF